VRSPDQILRQLLGRAVALPLIMVAILGGLLAVEVRALLGLTDWVDHTDRVIAEAQETLKLVADEQSMVRGFLLTGHEEFLDRQKTVREALSQQWRELIESVADNPEQTARARRAQELSDDLERRLDKAVAERRAGGRPGPPEEGDGRPLIDGIRTGLGTFLAIERDLLADRTQRVSESAKAAVLGALFAALLCGAALGLVARQQIRKVGGAYRELLELRDELLNMTAHELRTPVTSLLLQLELLERHGIEHGSVEVARRQARRLGELIEALIDANALSSGAEVPLERGDVDLRQVARAAVSKAAAGCEVQLDLDEAPVRGRWDEKRLVTAVSALVANACKFGRGKPVRVAVHRLPGEAEVSVTDQGPGLDGASDRIFGKFTRGVSQKSWGGLGLGLFAARRIAELHGGSLGVDGAGQGTRFTVRLPSGDA